jgi:hypothetical protein
MFPGEAVGAMRPQTGQSVTLGVGFFSQIGIHCPSVVTVSHLETGILVGKQDGRKKSFKRKGLDVKTG